MKRATRRTLPRELRDTTAWEDIDFAILGQDETVRAKALKEGIQKYLAFEKMGTFLSANGLTFEELLRALNRCIATHGNGKLFGWKGLLRHVRTKQYERVKPVEYTDRQSSGGFVGALGALFKQHPNIEASLESFCITGKRRKGDLPEARVTPALAHNRFKHLCKENKIGQDQWPFITKTEGRSAIANWLRELFGERYDEVVDRQYGEVASAKANTGRGIHSATFGSLPYDRWQMDEHSENLIGAVEVESPYGPIWFPAGRPSIIAVGDPGAPAILGYAMTFARAPESEDILDALEVALGDSPPHEFYLHGMHHMRGGGFPAYLDRDLCGYGCAVLEIDNALVHLARQVVSRIKDRLGCTILFGPVKRFECRAFIESVFGWLEKKGFLRCPSTTGTGPKDPRRRHAEEAAVKFKMSAEAIKDLTEALAGKFNARDEGACSRTAVDDIRHVLDDPNLGFLPTRVMPLEEGDPRLGITIETCTISGSRPNGDRPHVFLDGGRYEGEWLSDRWDLVGREVDLYIDRFRFRTMQLFLPNGVRLGEVAVRGWWAKSEHTRAQRKLLVTLLRQKRAIQSEDNDPVALFLHCMGQPLLKTKRARKKASREATDIAESNYRGYGMTSKRSDPEAATPALAQDVCDSDADQDVEEEELPTGVKVIN